MVALYLILRIWLKWPHNGHGDNGDGNFEQNIELIWLILDE
jgi:hypothetical protein